MGRLATVAESLYTNSVLFPDRRAIRCAVTGTTHTHKGFYDKCVVLGRALLRRGVPRGASVALFGRNSVAHVEVYGAAVLAGFVVVPINPSLGQPEVGEILERTHCVAALGLDDTHLTAQIAEDSRAALRCISTIPALIAAGETAAVTVRGGGEGQGKEHTDPLVPLAEEDVWAILFTSGTTTGRQKGVERTQGGSTAGFVTHTGPLRHFDHSMVGLVAFPLHGISSFFFAFLYLYVGGGMVIVDLLAPEVQNDPARALILANPEVTYITLSPSIMNGILSAPAPAHEEYRMRRAAGEIKANVIMLTGASAAPVLRRTVRDWFDVRVLVDVYGSTEAGLITMLLPDDLDVAPDSVGKETPGTLLCKLKDPTDAGRLITAPHTVGVVYVNTPMMMRGYLPNPHSPTAAEDLRRLYDADGYFNQGDLAYRCERGYLHLKGRVDDMIVLSSGHNVYPVEIETPMMRFLKEQRSTCNPEVYVVGLPSNARAETMAAVVHVASADDAAVVEASLIPAFAAAHARHPTRTIVVHPGSARRLPKTANGKVRKVLLPGWFEDAAQ